jgi:hypothetical protein
MKRAVFLTLLVAGAAAAQVYSPKVLLQGQPDASDPHLLAQGIYQQAGAHTPRERAEAIWRFFLTDGRFVKPGFWYHIAGWAYEEPMGEVLDTTKLLNNYGFGLCYQIAPVLEAVWRAGGFEDARVWFLTGHTVAEVLYDGAYHHYDSDMLGYNTIGPGPANQSPVASVHQLESDGNIILSKLKGPKEADPSVVDNPWYPADVRAGAMGGLAELFTTTSDNHLFGAALSALQVQRSHVGGISAGGRGVQRAYRGRSAQSEGRPHLGDGPHRVPAAGRCPGERHLRRAQPVRRH